MDIVFFVLLLVTLANFILASFVLWHNLTAETNRIFALTAISTGLWTLTNAVFRITPSPEIAMLAAQLSYLAAVALGASILHFSWTFPLHRDISSSRKGLLWTVALLVGLSPFVPGLIVDSITLTTPRSIETTSGVYMIAVFLVVTIGWAFGMFLNRHSSLRRVAREQSRYVLTGLGLATIIGLICNLLLPLLHNYRFVWLGPSASLFFVAFTVYAIIAHQLFDIRLIIKRTLVYSLLLAAVGAGYSLAEHAVTDFLGRIVENSDYAWLGNILGALFVGVFFAPVKKWLEEQVSRLLYKEHGHKARAE